MFKSGLAFVLSHIDVKCDVPIEIIPNHYFRKARPQEITQIIKMLEDFEISFEKMLKFPVNRGIPYDSIVKEIRRGNSCQYEREKLPPERWKYWVVAFEGSNAEIGSLQYAANLIKNDLDFAFQIIYVNKQQEGEPVGWMGMPTHLREYYSSHNAVNSNAVKVDQEEIKKIGEIYNLYKKLPSEYQYINHFIKNFNSLSLCRKITNAK